MADNDAIAPDALPTEAADPTSLEDAGVAPEADNGTEQSDAATTPEVAELLAQLRKKNREAANLRERVAKAEPAALELQAALERAQLAETDRDALLASLTRERVARRFNLPDELAERLRGESEEDIIADARRLASVLSANRAPSRLDVGQGVRNTPEPDTNAMFRRLARNAP